jgi:hypothetical protein
LVGVRGFAILEKIQTKEVYSFGIDDHPFSPRSHQSALGGGENIPEKVGGTDDVRDLVSPLDRDISLCNQGIGLTGGCRNEPEKPVFDRLDDRFLPFDGGMHVSPGEKTTAGSAGPTRCPRSECGRPVSR